MALYVLFESAVGYSLFEIAEAEEIGLQLDSVQVCLYNTHVVVVMVGFIWLVCLLLKERKKKNVV